ncbi:MAG TPA: hypothetical protein VGI10_08230 [Polyangiaceae bacterium]|jgi:hypothetical protein
MSRRVGVLVAATSLLVASNASAQFPPPQPLPQQPPPQQPFPPQQFPPQQPYPQQPYPQYPQQPYPGQYPAQPYPAQPGYAQPYVPPQSSSNARSGSEITVLYTTAAVYGVGLGVWFGSEAHIKDPGVFLIAPAILGVAAPVGVFLLDNPKMPRGMPGAIASGMVIGAAEGIGISSYQFESANKHEAWGFRGLSRATALGATLGGAGGFALGYLQEPSPKSSLLTSSAAVWGSAIGAMFGYGSSAKGIGYGLANDSAGLGGLIGLNVGVAAAAGLSTVYVPSYTGVGYMWGGAAVGMAVSLPVYLFYAGSSQPAKRGLIFSGTATSLGVLAGGLLGANTTDSASSEFGPRFASIDYLIPTPMRGGAGLVLGGSLQ